MEAIKISGSDIVSRNVETSLVPQTREVRDEQQSSSEEPQVKTVENDHVGTKIDSYA